MSPSVHSAFERLEDDFRACRLDRIGACYATPLPVYANGEVFVLKSGADVRQALARHRIAATQAAGYRGDIIETQIDESGKGSVTVCFRYDMTDGGTRHGLSTYYLDPRADRARIVMVDIHELGLNASFPTLKGAESAPGVLQ